MDPVFKKELWLLIVLFVAGIGMANCQTADSYRWQDGELFIKIPQGISRSDVGNGDLQKKIQLHSYAESVLAIALPHESAMNDLDVVITFTDADDRPILPNAERASSQNYSAARAQTNQITYTFNSTAIPWTSDQVATLNTWVTDIYPAIKKVVGNPFFNITVNVSYNPGISSAGLYYRSDNEMVLRSLAADVFCHESIHAFRDDYGMGVGTYEEGMTRAGEIEVFNQLTAYTHPSDEFHSYSYDVYYELLNRPNIGTTNGQITSNPALVVLKYNISSYAWAKCYLEDNDFFKRFNDSLYGRVVANLATRDSEPALRSIVQNIKPCVEGLPVAMWYQRQYILDPAPSPGYKLYQRGSDYIIDYFYRNNLGSEQPQSGLSITWQILDNTDALLMSGIGISSSLGWIGLQPVFGNYVGKIKIVASVQSPQGTIRDTVMRSNQSNASGVFGIVDGANTGTVYVTPIDTALGTYSATLTNGAFFLPSLQQVRGRFRVEFAYPDCNRYTRIFTKDRSDYFIAIHKEAFTYWVGSVDSLWGTWGNWSGGFVPDQCTDVIALPNTPFKCVIQSPAYCRKLTLNPGAILTIKNNLMIEGF